MTTTPFVRPAYHNLELQPLAGQWRAGSAGRTLDVFDPFTQTRLLQITQANREDLDAAYRKARVSQLDWATKGPAERGQVVLDLKRMNRILEVDPDLCFALVEPGVTYKQLYDYIQEHKYPLWLSCPAPSAIAGPTGNTLDRGVGYTPYGEHFLFACGMEVVLANGEVLRTGMGSLPKSNTWQVFKWGYGPYLDGIFTQSNYGIVTKFGFWLMPAPPTFKPFVIQYENEDDIVEIVETIRPLRISGVIPNAVVIAHALYDAPTKARRSDYMTGPCAITDEAVRQFCARPSMRWRSGGPAASSGLRSWAPRPASM